jgi:hypothetical protein
VTGATAGVLPLAGLPLRLVVMDAMTGCLSYS